MLGRGRQLQEDQRQQREDQRLHKGHKDLKRDEYDISQARYQECKHRQHCASRENVAEKTEGERKDAGKLGDELDQPDEELNGTLVTMREQVFEPEILTDMLARRRQH